MADEKNMTRVDFEAQLVKRAWAEPEFKKKLLTNPREAIEEELRKLRPDAKLPATTQYYVHEETPNSLHITLPMNPADLGSKDEWDNYAQGGCIAVVVAGAVAVVAGAVKTVAGNISVVGNVVGTVNHIGTKTTVTVT